MSRQAGPEKPAAIDRFSASPKPVLPRGSKSNGVWTGEALDLRATEISPRVGRIAASKGFSGVPRGAGQSAIKLISGACGAGWQPIANSCSDLNLRELEWALRGRWRVAVAN